MSVSLFNQNLKEARRDALVSHYLATHDFSSLPDGSSVTTAEDLYEYLLLDTKISNAVTTTRLAEAVSSLQLLIHRGLEGDEGELADEATKYLAYDAFLDNWDRYNKRYSTWAGKEKMRFYAGNYVEPSLRTNKTQLFKDFESLINQAQLTESNISDAIQNYFSAYNQFANIKYHSEISSSGIPVPGVVYIIGRAASEYFYQKVNIDSVGGYIFSEWFSLPFLSGKEIEAGNLTILTYPEKLICILRENKRVQNTEFLINTTQDVVPPEYTTIISAYLNENEKWRECNVPIYFEYQKDDITQLHLVIDRSNYGDAHIYVNNNNIIGEVIITHKQGGGYKVKYLNSVDNAAEMIITKVGSDVTYNVKNNESIYIDVINNDSYEFHFPDKIPDKQFLFKANAAVQHVFETFASGMPYISEPTYEIAIGEPDSEEEYRSVSYISPEITPSYNLFKGVYGSLQSYEMQKSAVDSDAEVFKGAYGQYLWEIFFHIPYLVATRFATEQRFEEAERWYKFIFNSTGYRDEDGHNLTGDNGQTRYWNCYPLQQDAAWDSFTTMPASTDPDVIATADPMHYKLAIFQHTLDLLIARGDAAYRLLERDTLTEAKMYYVQALQLLGPRPDIRVTNTWDNPTLSAEADAIQIPATRSEEGASLTFAQWLRAGDTSEMGDGNFLPPYNDVLLAYWDKLDIRLYNLRHNLSLDGQPLNLPLFATPVDPTELLRQQSGGDGVQEESSLMSLPVDTGWRYPRLADNARFAVGVLMQFGNTLLGALERRDGEQLALLMQTQQIAVLGLQQDIAQKNLDSLNASIEALNAVRSSAEMRKNYYDNLINGDLSAAEIAGLTLRSTAMATNVASLGTLIAAGALSATPNIFGLADGGGDWGAPLHAATQGTQIAAMAQDQSATISEITANYQRRKEDWLLQRDLADKDIIQSESQTESLKAQIAMQHKQITLAEEESANAQAVYDLQSSRFTGQVLYNWMVSRLSTLYYQLYDATIPVCIQAREALKRELGNNRADGVFSTPVWNDLYQGLLAGEGLTTELQKLENVWIQNSANGLEATRTVSLAMLRNEESGSLSAAIGNVLGGISEADGAIGQLKLDDSHIFSAVLDMSVLQLTSDYGLTSSSKNLFIKSIAVTLPTLLGPYQDIAATLSDNKGSVATLSHGMQDAGRFVVNFDDSRFLPFEGMDPTQLTLTLSIFNVKEAGDAAPNQRSIVENLSDIIFHIRYIMRDK